MAKGRRLATLAAAATAAVACIAVAIFLQRGGDYPARDDSLPSATGAPAVEPAVDAAYDAQAAAAEAIDAAFPVPDVTGIIDFEIAAALRRHRNEMIQEQNALLTRVGTAPPEGVSWEDKYAEDILAMEEFLHLHGVSHMTMPLGLRLASLYRYLDHIDEARALLSQLLAAAHEPDDSRPVNIFRVMQAMAGLERQMGNIGAAERIFLEALELPAQYDAIFRVPVLRSEVALGLAGLYARSGRNEKALRLLDDVSQRISRLDDNLGNDTSRLLAWACHTRIDVLRANAALDDIEAYIREVDGLVQDYRATLNNLANRSSRPDYYRQQIDRGADNIYSRAINALAGARIRVLFEAAAPGEVESVRSAAMGVVREHQEMLEGRLSRGISATERIYDIQEAQQAIDTLADELAGRGR